MKLTRILCQKGIFQYWLVKNGENHFLYSVVVRENPLSVNFFTRPPGTVKGDSLHLDDDGPDDIWEVFIKDFVRNVPPPTVQAMGKFRKSYRFE